MAGKVQMVYIDPPSGIKYGSNFQPFVNKRDVKDRKDEDLTREPETLKAFRDTWELGIHSYLAYLRDRLILAHELLHESGSCFVQIGDENVHLVRSVMDAVLGTENFIANIAFKKTSATASDRMDGTFDMLIWYAKEKVKRKYRQLYEDKGLGSFIPSAYNRVFEADGTSHPLSAEEREYGLSDGARLYALDNLTSSRPAGEGDLQSFEFKGRRFTPGNGTFKTDRSGLERLAAAQRLEATSARLGYVRFLDDFPAIPMANLWTDTVSSFMPDKVYVVQTVRKIVAHCILMTTDPGDIVFDTTCGSGTTAFVAEQWGRRWITTDTSRVAIALTKQRLTTAVFDYYELAHPEQGVGSGFNYKTVPHVTLKSIANNPEIKEGMAREQIDAAIAKYAPQETLYDQPNKDRSKARVTGPFTVEAVPAPVVTPIAEVQSPHPGPLPGGEREGGAPTIRSCAGARRCARANGGTS